MATQDQAAEKAFDLMAELDRLAFTQEPNLGKDPNWVPESAEGKVIFARLTAAENRQTLKRWYASFRNVVLNPSAVNLKKSLERAVNEPLD